MSRYMIIHHSHNWIYGPYMKRFEALEEAKKYIRQWKGKELPHKDDEFEIVEILSSGEAVSIGDGLVRLKEKE